MGLGLRRVERGGQLGVETEIARPLPEVRTGDAGGDVTAGDVAVLIEASDGAADGRKKIGRKAAATETLSHWTSDQLGGPFGRDRAVHVAILSKGLADRLVRDGRRLKGLRSKGADDGARLELQES